MCLWQWQWFRYWLGGNGLCSGLDVSFGGDLGGGLGGFVRM